MSLCLCQCLAGTVSLWHAHNITVSQGLRHCVEGPLSLCHKHNFTLLQGLCRCVINAVSLCHTAFVTALHVLCHSVAEPVSLCRRACFLVPQGLYTCHCCRVCVSMACVTGPMLLKACLLSTPIVCRQTF